MVMLPPEYRKYENIIKAMKNKLHPRMEEMFFDDNFYQNNQEVLNGLFKQGKTKKLKAPYERNLQQLQSSLPPGSNGSMSPILEGNYNIIVPLGSTKYESLRSPNVNVVSYTSKEDINQYLHQAGVFNIIVCDKASYQSFKEFPKMSPRCKLLV